MHMPVNTILVLKLSKDSSAIIKADNTLTQNMRQVILAEIFLLKSYFAKGTCGGAA